MPYSSIPRGSLAVQKHCVKAFKEKSRLFAVILIRKMNFTKLVALYHRADTLGAQHLLNLAAIDHDSHLLQIRTNRSIGGTH
jgi:hypothetical protein